MLSLSEVSCLPMQPPIPSGTILQNRYRVLSILGQGGFGRTYLAEDSNRYNELCAMKEFIPPQGSDYTLNKARELFQREAAILYQISHPQIPQFRATFEENQRLFLVQDYVEGKTYRALLNERKVRSATFSEAEALQLLYQLLPVLAHIHSKGIIHRDIAPDNIILREKDNLPVLIDFGVVKEIVTRFQASETDLPTTVGKLGYAPSEQMQTGRAYPNSDLYSLAVTAVVLMTGREPHELYDDRNLVWNWQRWVPNVYPGFAEVLNRMLSYRPGDRYQSVSDVAQALQALVNPSMPPRPAVAPTPTPTPVSRVAKPAANPDLSQMKTVAVGRRGGSNYNSTSYTPKPAPARPVPPPVIPTTNETSIWDNIWAVLAVGTGLATVTGIAAWAIVSAILNTTQPTPSITPTPTPVGAETPIDTPISEPSPTLTPDQQPVEYTQRLDLQPNGATTTVEGSLQANESIVYTFPATEGQTLTATVEGEGVLLSVLAPDGQPAGDQAEGVASWKGSLNATGDYTIRLKPIGSIPASNYRLKANLEEVQPPAPDPFPEPSPEPSPEPLPAPSPDPSPEPTPSPSPAPDYDVQFLTPDPNGTQVSDQSSDVRIKRYLVNAQPGQVLKAEILQGAVTLNIRYPDGRPVENASGVVTWNARIFEGGEYQIDVMATQPTEFAMNVAVQEGPSPFPGSPPN